ncbi:MULTISPECIES: TrkH family potassium uptake protein [Bacillus]|uniref:TrkH family potassium uptake protein n=1 Tax=Bacillus TaxID=1386 RepID=UPI001C629F8F|nr:MULTISPECIES: TrkH family potassium uptake protein [Bacillus]QWU44256.1 TrkH family potassium uptake protein [Bacillus sp. NP247]UYX53845.1 TrkH family potassium uptake protein [Bacillus thuringiensis]
MEVAKKQGLYNRLVRLNPPQILALGFFCLIVVGGLLLKLPFATKVHISWVDAFFTATSAATVTGLGVVDTASTFTMFGEIVIMFLIQTGGLGLMTIAILIVWVLGKKIGLRHRLLIGEAFNQTNIGGLVKLVKRVFIFSICIELIGVIFLSMRFIPEFGFGKGLYYSIFHVIASYNNAGFALWPDNLTRYVGDPIINIGICSLIVIGGLGFTVLIDIWYSRSFRKLSLHSKIMIVGTVALNIIAMIVIFVLEYNNVKTLGNLSLNEKLWASFFQGITPRTAGFNTVDYGGMEESSILFTMVLMFIGAGSVSTGGGIKLTTFVILITSVLSFFRKKEDFVLFQRTIKMSTVTRALAIVVASQILIFTAVFVLMLTEDFSFIQLLFETISAFGTVGLTMGITAKLSAFGKCIIMFVMFCGLIGPLTLVFSLARPAKQKIKYPSEDVFTG